MAKQTVAQIAAQFIVHLQEEEGLTIFRENHLAADNVTQEHFLYILPPGQHGGNTSNNQLIQKVFQWVNGTASGPRSMVQAKNIAREVWNQAPLAN